MRFTLEQLRTDPQLWSRFWVRPTGNHQYPLEEIAAIAFDFLDQTHSIRTSEKDERSGGLIDGALNAIVLYVDSSPQIAYATCRRIGRYFSSANINTAFGAIRKFEQSRLSRYIIFVSDLLVNVAVCPTPTPSPIEMTVRGIAFRVLFQLDPGFKHWPSLREARDECVHGLLTWGRHTETNAILAKSILQYTENAK